MRRLHLLLFALLLPTGVALGQEGAQPSAPPPPAEPAPPPPPPPPPPEAPSPPEAPPTPRAERPPPEEQKPGMETLISGQATQGAYGAPVLMYSRVMDRDALFLGGQGGWIANHQFVIGAAGYFMATRIPAPPGVVNLGEDLRLEFGYGGLWLEYIFLPDKIVHASLGTLLGGGVTNYVRLHYSSHEDRTRESDVVLVAAPVLAVELNITRTIRLSVGAGYRYVGSVDLTGMHSQDANSFTGSVLVKFGRF
ncbi:MAG: hypothetical protein ACJ8AT_09695 [Hyalangium sp.]|uniref:hypothetical protein n=1 Tax=Hyalangium sp. TaxID=2028555 RepID=UPI00389AA9A2